LAAALLILKKRASVNSPNALHGIWMPDIMIAIILAICHKNDCSVYLDLTLKRDVELALSHGINT
jgi:hypothetical protein